VEGYSLCEILRKKMKMESREKECRKRKRERKREFCVCVCVCVWQSILGEATQKEEKTFVTHLS
jgi:hypothetical protein